MIITRQAPLLRQRADGVGTCATSHTSMLRVRGALCAHVAACACFASSPSAPASTAAVRTSAAPAPTTSCNGPAAHAPPPAAPKLLSRPAGAPPKSGCFGSRLNPVGGHLRGAMAVAASSASAVSAPSSSPAETEAGSGAAEFEFVCPICLSTSFRLAGMPSQSTGLACPRCARTFPASPAFLDLTLTAGAQQRVYSQRAWGGTELFRSPLVSFAYERGWRQGFAWAGFPGADAEYDMAMSYLLPAARGRVLVDMSCGSGLFSRRFARSGQFSGVVAADFSEAMLQQTREYCRAEGEGQPGSCPIVLLRADVGRLPFPTGSVAALHAGAAIHCWPNPQAALAEISRVLAPGGVFVASTFLTAAAPLGAVLGDDAVRPLSKLDPTSLGGALSTPYRWWEEAELRELCEAVGLTDFRRQRQWRFIMFAATKPAPPPPAPGGAPLTDLE